MSEEQNIEQELQEAYYSGYEFKSQEIKPPSKGRLSLILGLIDASTVGPFDVHTFIYGLTCPVHTLMKGRRDKAWFDELVLAWIDANIEDGDIALELAIVKDIMDKVNGTQAEAIPAPGEGFKPSGNEPSQ